MQWSYAQRASETTVHLRNGSIVKGKLTYLDSDRMQIETPNGSTILFTEKAVKKMVRDNQTSTTRSRSTSSSKNQYRDDDRFSNTTVVLDDDTDYYYYNDDLDEEYREEDQSRESYDNRDNRRSTYRYSQYDNRNATKKKPQDDITGYRGFVDIGYTFATGDDSRGRFELTTSHGYQMNPYFFIGAGTGFHYYKPWKYTESSSGISVSLKETLTAIPIFADFRANFTENGPIIPFASIKMGYSIGIAKAKASVEANIGGYDLDESESESHTEGLGFYLAPSIGAKYMISPSFAINLSLGYTGQFDKDSNNAGGISIKAGIEF